MAKRRVNLRSNLRCNRTSVYESNVALCLWSSFDARRDWLGGWRPRELLVLGNSTAQFRNRHYRLFECLTFLLGLSLSSLRLATKSVALNDSLQKAGRLEPRRPEGHEGTVQSDET